MARDPASRADNSSSTPEEAAANTAARNDGNRSGHDERKRGWFWHWNGIVTQYVPLIGLKGVGLLNSYTVWTDRREDSPHRGYAFPSQQSEANFYGEDRSELITINKILVVLDLIEIRKEMIRKIDEQGRRWKVPQNLYRVKDRQDGIDLTAADVLRVIELADKDKAVYRHIRKIFSSRFEPIDRDNVWHGILAELSSHPTWEKLAARAAKQEARASARTKAGHRSRARQQQQEETNQEESPTAQANKGPSQWEASDNDSASLTTGHDNEKTFTKRERKTPNGLASHTTADDANSGSGIDVAQTNNGSRSADEPANNGFHAPERGSVASANNGHESSVEPGNTMYYESFTTTTTTTNPAEDDNQTTRLPSRSGDTGKDDGRRSEESNGRSVGNAQDHHPTRPAGVDGDLVAGAPASSGSPEGRRLAGAPGAGPLGDPSPLVLSLYEAANDRAATGLERILLSELEGDAGAPARAAGSTGPDWVAAALREAVGSGSAFVAPKRIREIVNRWANSDSGPRGQHQPDPTPADNRHVSESVADGQVLGKQLCDKSRDEYPGSDVLVVQPVDAAQGERLWNVVLDILADEGIRDNLVRLRGVIPIGERSDGEFVLGAPTRLAARLLDGTYRLPVERALASLLPSPVTIDIVTPDRWRVDG